MVAAMTRESFIEKAIIKYGNKFGYENVEFIDRFTEVKLKCNLNNHNIFYCTPDKHLRLGSCPQCISKLNEIKLENARKINHNKFILKCLNILGNIFDYTNTYYINAHTKIIIGCQFPDHGFFTTTPREHIFSKHHGCDVCFSEDARQKILLNGINHSNLKLNQSEIISKFITIHNSLYDYTKVIYLSNYKNIEIICKIHGSFWQTPENHCQGHGCPKCANILKGKNKSRGKEDFVSLSIKKFGDKFIYTEVIYINQYEKINLICKIHGTFEQIPKNHLNSMYGCPQCAGEILITKNKKFTDINKLIDNLNIIFNFRYKYYKCLNLNSICMNSILEIECIIHGFFTKTVKSHLNGTGCPRCSNSSISKLETEWLNIFNILNLYRNIKIPNSNKKFKVDGIDIENKIIYEFNGDFWHGNPIKFNRQDINAISNKTFGCLYDETIDRLNIISKMGYKIITIWEYNYKKYKKDISSGIATTEDILQYCEIYEQITKA